MVIIIIINNESSSHLQESLWRQQFQMLFQMSDKEEALELRIHNPSALNSHADDAIPRYCLSWPRVTRTWALLALPTWTRDSSCLGQWGVKFALAFSWFGVCPFLSVLTSLHLSDSYHTALDLSLCQYILLAENLSYLPGYNPLSEPKCFF